MKTNLQFLIHAHTSEDVKRKRGTKNPGDHEIQTRDLLIQGIGVPIPAWLPWILIFFILKRRFFALKTFVFVKTSFFFFFFFF